MTRTSDQAPRPAEQLRADARQNRARLITAATAAFAEKGADAPLEDIARRAGVGIGTLYRHFPTRLDLQAAVFRSQVGAVCGKGEELAGTVSPEDAFAGYLHALAGYLVTKRGLSHALIEAVGIESELISSCWVAMRETTERLLSNAQQAGGRPAGRGRHRRDAPRARGVGEHREGPRTSRHAPVGHARRPARPAPLINPCPRRRPGVPSPGEAPPGWYPGSHGPHAALAPRAGPGANRLDVPLIRWYPAGCSIDPVPVPVLRAAGVTGAAAGAVKA